MKRNCKKQSKEFRIEKKLRKKEISCMSNGKAMITDLIAELIRKTLYKTSQYFPKQHQCQS